MQRRLFCEELKCLLIIFKVRAFGMNTSTMMVRPEDFKLESVPADQANGIVKSVDFSGSVQTVGVALKSGASVQVSGSPHLLWNQSDSVKIKAERYLCFNSSGNRLNGIPE